MNRKVPPQRFTKKKVKPKVLVMGHSWVKDIEEEHLRKPVSDFDLEFAYEEGIRINGLIDMIPRVMATYHTHILLFSVLPDALSLYSIENQNPMASQYKVLGPNKEFNPDYFAHQMNIFTEHCKVINPQVKIILMIPPVTDLVYHNHIRVSYYPFMIQNAYKANPQFDERLLIMCMKDLHSSINMLKGNQCTWVEKTVYPLQIVALSISFIRNSLLRFLKGEICTMGDASHLRDGFHPNSLFIEKMWAKLKTTGLLNESNSMSPKSSSFSKPQNIVKNKETSQFSPIQNKSKSAPLKGILKKKKLDSTPPAKTNPPPRKDTTVISILKRPSVSAKNESKFSSTTKHLDSNNKTSPDEKNEINNGPERESNDFISQKSLSVDQSALSKNSQQVTMNYMSQEMEKFASFMAGHAHAVGQNLTLREIKQMMIDILKDQV